MKTRQICGFWQPHQANGELSQWYRSPFTDDEGLSYTTAEQYMMVQKAKLFGDEDSVQKMLKTNDPKALKALGRKVLRFDEDAWREHREDIVYQGNMYKFTQNKDLKKFLLDTGDSYLVELSPYDKIWGVGSQSRNSTYWNGLNLLGVALMKVRKDLQ